MQRRNFLQTIAATPALIPSLSNHNKPTLKPARLKAGDTVGLVCPAAPAYSKQTVQVIVESMQALGFKVKFGKRMWERYGYLAGKDADRAADLNDMFADSSVQAIICVHGGWGCARLLPLLDYDTIKQNPKVLLGYSDVTALLLGIYSQTGLVTFHGPVGAVSWIEFTVGYLRKILMEGEAVRYENPKVVGDNLTQVADRIDTIVAGKAKGRLLGGNLTVLSHLLGSPYVPDWKGSLFFCEDVDEAPYRVDRMLTQLKLSGILNDMNGFIFGKCTECEPGNGSYGSLTLEDLWLDHIQPAQTPAFAGAMIGHIRQKFTIPVGIEAEIDASTGIIQLLEKAVV